MAHVENKRCRPESTETRFPLRLRIPYWSANTDVKLNVAAVKDVKPGSYLALDRLWKAGDRIEMSFDFTLHYWIGERRAPQVRSLLIAVKSSYHV